MAPHHTITLKDIYLAHQRITPMIRRTPIVEAAWLSRYLDAKVVMKLDNLQVTGSFKIRGASNKLLCLKEEERARGVITVSSGNHGRAVAYGAQKLGLGATVCISEPVPQNKRQAIQDLGAELIVGGKDADQAMEFADKYQIEHGLTMIHPFDDPDVIAGQGTIGLELLEDFPEIDTVLVPLSGGGLCSGIALALKSANPSFQVIGVSMERGPAMVDSLKAGKIVDIVEQPTLADALAGGLNKDNTYTFRMIQKYVDDTVLVSEEEIATAMSFLLEKHHLVVEGGGAVGVAALLHQKVKHLGQKVAVVISGGNVDLPVLMRVANETQFYPLDESVRGGK